MKEAADLAAEGASSIERVVVVNRLGRTDCPHSPGRDIEWSEFTAAERWPLTRRAPSAVSVPSDHPLLLMYTSGTTGRPKGAVLSHAGVVVMTARDAAYHFDLQAKETLCWVTDMGWIMGPWQLIASWVLGATVVMLEGLPTYSRPGRLWEIVDRHAITTLGVGPSLVRGLASENAKPADEHEVRSLRIIGATGEPWSYDAWMWLFREVGRGRCPIINFSGGTEVGGAFLAPLPVMPQVACTLGGPCMGMDMDIVDQEGRSLPAGQVGELVCRRPWPAMTKGIWKDPERYLDAYWRRLPGVWVHGDWASRDDQGFWFLHGRSDDTLNIAGKRLGPTEVEGVLAKHPAVWESAAVAVPHELKGEVIWCFTVLRRGVEPNSALASELQSLVAAHLGKAFRPERVVFVGDLPRTKTAKIVRRVIRCIAIGKDPGDVFGLEDPGAIDAIHQALAGHT
jgi:acetyl-CoA synthetase